MKKLMAILICVLIIFIVLSYPGIMWEIYRSKIKRVFRVFHK